MYKKAYFVHIPKTAGNSVRESIRNYSLGYYSPSLEHDILSNPGISKIEREHHFGIKNATRVINSHRSFTTSTFPSYADNSNYKKSDFSFSIVRNPFDLLVSYYSHYVVKDCGKNKETCTCKFGHGIDRGWANVCGYHNINSFKQFIDLYCNIDPEDWHVPELNRNLFGQLKIDTGCAGVDYSIFFENLSAGIRSILDISLGHETSKLFPIELKRKNVSQKRFLEFQEMYTPSMLAQVEKKCEWEFSTFYNNGSVKNSIVNLKKILSRSQEVKN